MNDQGQPPTATNKTCLDFTSDITSPNRLHLCRYCYRTKEEHEAELYPNGKPSEETMREWTKRKGAADTNEPRQQFYDTAERGLLDMTDHEVVRRLVAQGASDVLIEELETLRSMARQLREQVTAHEELWKVHTEEIIQLRKQLTDTELRYDDLWLTCDRLGKMLAEAYWSGRGRLRASLR